jgi:hypothetical protein
MDDPAVGSAFIFTDVAAFHNDMVARDLKNIGMHEKDQDVGSEFELKLKLAAIMVLKQNRVGRFDDPGFVAGNKFFAFLFKGAKSIGGFEINLLLEGAFFNDGVCN